MFLHNDKDLPPPLVLGGNVPNGAVGEAYSATVAASGGTPGYSYGVSGTLPEGLLFEASSGVLSGTPLNSGSFEFSVAVSDSSGRSTSVDCQVTITGLEILTTSLPGGTVGVDYSASISAARGTAPYAFNLITNTGETGLPGGYSLSDGGEITNAGGGSSASQQAGTYTFTVQVTDSAGQTAQRRLTFVLHPTGGTTGGGTTSGITGGGGSNTNTTTSTPPVITLACRENSVVFRHTPPQTEPQNRYGASDSEKDQLVSDGWHTAPLNPSDPEMQQLYPDDDDGWVPPTWHLIRNVNVGDYYTHDVKKFDESSPQPILDDAAIRTLISNNESGPDITEHLQFQPAEPDKAGNGSDTNGHAASRGSTLIGASVFQTGNWQEFWLKASTPVPEEVSRTYLIRRTSGSGGSPHLTAVTLTIPKDGKFSTQGGTNGTIKLHPEEGETLSLLPVEFEFKLERRRPPGPDEVRNYVERDSRLQNGTKPDLRSEVTITALANFDLGAVTTTRGNIDTLNPANGVCGADGKFKTTLSTHEKAPLLKVQARGAESPEHNMLPALYRNQFHITGYSTPSESDPRFTGARVNHTTLTTGSGATRRVYDITSPRVAKSDFLRSLAVEGEGYFEDGTHAVVSNRTTPGTSNPIETTTTITTNNLRPKGTRNRDLVADSSCAITRSSGNGIVIPDAASVHVVGQAGNWSAIDQVSSTETGGVYHIDLYKGFDRAAADLISADTDVILLDY